MRILPLLASATEIVHILGLGRYQVGRSHECDFPADIGHLPVCTEPAFPTDNDSRSIDQSVKSRLEWAASLYDLDSELIGRLRPSHIITQTQCKVCAVSLDDVERTLREKTATDATIVSLEAYSLDGIWQDIERVAVACDRVEAGKAAIASLQETMSGISGRAYQSAKRWRVAAIEWLEPVMCAGNWVPELISMCNAEPVCGVAGMHSPYVKWEEVSALDPDVVIAMPCGFDLSKTRSEMHWMTERPGWQDLKAVRNGRVYLCDGNQYMNRSGPRIVESLKIIAEILHPELLSPELLSKGWEPF